MFWAVPENQQKYPEFFTVYNLIISMTPSYATILVHSMYTAILTRLGSGLSCTTVIKLLLSKSNLLFGSNPRNWKSMFAKEEFNKIVNEDRVFETFSASVQDGLDEELDEIQKCFEVGDMEVVVEEGNEELEEEMP